MVDWSSPASLAHQDEIVRHLDFALLGIMLWECLITSKFDFEVLSRRRPFKWPFLLYLTTKWGTLLFIVGVIVTDSNVRLDCQTVGRYINLMSGIGMAGSSCILMLRAIALWRRDLRVLVPLVVLNLGQWALNIHDAFIVKEHWGDQGNGNEGCIFTSVTWPWWKAQFIYTLIFDFLVLILASVALIRFGGHSTLWKLLFIDGLSYFLAAFTSYLACTIVAYMGVSIILAWMFADTANIFVAIAACRSFLRLATRGNLPTPVKDLIPCTNSQFDFNRPLETPTIFDEKAVGAFPRDRERPPGDVDIEVQEDSR